MFRFSRMTLQAAKNGNGKKANNKLEEKHIKKVAKYFTKRMELETNEIPTIPKNTRRSSPTKPR